MTVADSVAGPVADIFEGAEVALDLGFLERSYSDTGPSPVKVKAKVLKCQRCMLHETCRRPVPWTGRDCDFAVLGEAPGETEDAKGRPFVGKAGNVMRALIEWAELDDLDVGFVNTVSCRPPDNRTPQMVEQGRCRELMFDQLEVIGSRYVILAGATAVRAWRTDLNVSTWHGHFGLWGDNLVVMPLLHPAVLLGNRVPNKREIRDQMIAELKMFGKVVRGEVDVRQMFGRRCGVGSCSMAGSVAYIDPDGIGWCRGHIETGKKMWEITRAAWNEWEQAEEDHQDELPF